MRDAKEMTINELEDWYIRLGEAHGGEYNYDLRRWIEKGP